MEVRPEDYAVSLPFFGIPRIMPYVRSYRRTLFVMIVCGLCGSAVDIFLPLLQRYALNHFIALNTLDTLPVYIGVYLFAIRFVCPLFILLIFLHELGVI